MSLLSQDLRRIVLAGLGVALLCSTAARAQSSDSQRPKAPRERDGAVRPPLAGPQNGTQPERADDARTAQPEPGDEMDDPPQPNVIGRRGSPPGPLMERFTDQDFDEMLRFLDEHFPDWADELRRMRETNDPRFQPRFGRMFPRLRQLMMDLRDDPESGRLSIANEKLEMKVRAMARDYANIPANEDQAGRDALRRQMRATLQEQFDVRRQRMQHEIGRLERRLSDLRERTERQQTRRDALIDGRLENLLDGGPLPPLDEPPLRPGRRGSMPNRPDPPRD